MAYCGASQIYSCLCVANAEYGTLQSSKKKERKRKRETETEKEGGRKEEKDEKKKKNSQTLSPPNILLDNNNQKKENDWKMKGKFGILKLYVKAAYLFLFPKLIMSLL